MKKIIYIVIALACLAVGFLIGRSTISTTVAYSNVKLPPVSGTFPGIEPLIEEYPVIPNLPMKPDTVRRDSLVYITQKVDTAAIITEYQLKRIYEQTLFDDSFGRIDVRVTNQYNRLADLSYVYTPIQQVRTIERIKVWQPFVSASYSTLNYVAVGGGLFYHDAGLSVRYVTDFKRNGIEAGVMYKF